MSGRQKTRFLKLIVSANFIVSTLIAGTILAICWRAGIMDAAIAAAVLAPYAIENYITMALRKNEKKEDNP